jgi:hypothetical protein
MCELAWIEGVTFAVEYRWAEGRSERFGHREVVTDRAIKAWSSPPLHGHNGHMELGQTNPWSTRTYHPRQRVGPTATRGVGNHQRAHHQSARVFRVG